MKAEYREKFPEWVNEDKYYDLCLSNDLDSLFSCKLLEKIKGYKIKWFYNFHCLYKAEDAINEAIAVDIDLIRGKCWGNHVTPFYNPEAANLNIIDSISHENYFDKYAGSTLLEIWSYYDIPLPQSEEAKMILLAIDSFYLGFYSNYLNDILANAHYMQVLELRELQKILYKYKSKDFEEIKRKYNLYGKIWIDENKKLASDIRLAELSEIFDLDLTLPSEEFSSHYYFTPQTTKISTPGGKIFSAALVGRNKIKYSVVA
ncbi:hypothetical protein [Thermosediminibacter oceani]|uniref:Uncharacterized protein n=1 Tax=Thermosediminibacter oceani (strain ATCC BAA-1034 / DSM 16646 / JW/IW-1228P) TaxID=555079 RepID=D9S2Y3_THEOJ|nr:hypothetical protein [Thermosediminibacter oceani]ADL07760.1 conserved hypothetical protein [Thermosediminibacter oceani DSM 16646]